MIICITQDFFVSQFPWKALLINIVQMTVNVYYKIKCVYDILNTCVLLDYRLS